VQFADSKKREMTSCIYTGGVMTSFYLEFEQIIALTKIIGVLRYIELVKIFAVVGVRDQTQAWRL
jgi:hypothetical protein